MTEEEWKTATNPSPMLISMSGPASERKLRLLAVANCSKHSTLFGDPREQKGLVAAELLADGAISETDRFLAQENVLDLRDERYDTSRGVSELMLSLPWEILESSFVPTDANSVLRTIVDMACYSARNVPGLRDLLFDEQVRILRDIFGNPFRPVTFDPRWRSSDVFGLAQAIYDNKAFERMPILADALMDAGCEEEQIISHCRGEGPHVRGCWVVDLVLGKS